MTYNLSTWLCMKQPYMILSLLILGPKTPGNDIDVFLELSRDELIELWEPGIEMYDALKNEACIIQGAFIFIINDFPIYGNLLG